MNIPTKPKIYPDVVNTYKFYMMLGIKATFLHKSEKESTESLRAFTKHLKENHQFSDFVIQYQMQVAYESLPSDFLSIMQISTPGDRDTLKFIGEWK